MATMKQVAERAGVSVATVSYVLNDTCKVRPETQARVFTAAKELDYLPRAVARSLVLGRTSLLGLIVPEIGNPFFPESHDSNHDHEIIATGVRRICQRE